MSRRFKKGLRVWSAALTLAAVVSNVAPTPSRADVFSTIPEASGYQLVYTLPIPDMSTNWNTNAVPYTVNNAASIADGSFSRVGYYLELQPTGGGASQYVYASMNASGFTRKASQLGVPTTTSGAFFQQTVSSLNVVSNVSGIVNGTGISTGNIEFWPSNYTQANAINIPNASASTFDFGDGGASTAAGYGSMQIHNYGASQTLFSYSRWGQSGTSDLGIGNQVGGSGNPDWTFNGQSTTFTPNIKNYSVKTLQVVVGGGALPPPPPAGPRYMPLGDSITYGQPVPGGYRNRLFTLLSTADPTHTPDFVGSAVDNPSANLSSAGEANHEGHPGYVINQLTSNLDGTDNSSGNNGGFWLTGGGGTGRAAINPDFILLHIGTNDISGGASAATAATRLGTLIDKIETLRPDATLIVASLIPRNDSNEATSVSYNALIPGLVAQHQALGQKVYFTDMHSLLTTADLSDTVHPNQAGYDKMADGWYAALQSVPEPSAGLVLVLAGVPVLFLRRRRAPAA